MHKWYVLCINVNEPKQYKDLVCRNETESNSVKQCVETM